jgi:hypothetical protein
VIHSYPLSSETAVLCCTIGKSKFWLNRPVSPLLFGKIQTGRSAASISMPESIQPLLHRFWTRQSAEGWVFSPHSNAAILHLLAEVSGCASFRAIFCRNLPECWPNTLFFQLRDKPYTRTSPKSLPHVSLITEMYVAGLSVEISPINFDSVQC